MKIRRERKVPGGIYPILNINSEVDVDKLLDWAVRLSGAGVEIVQLRLKGIPGETLLPALDDLTGMLKGSGLTVVLDDYVEMVSLTGADGVHVGEGDFPVADARRILGDGLIIGSTCRTPEQAIEAVAQGASYVSAGSVYESKTKGGLPVIGLYGLKRICDAVLKSGGIPVCAIGGITLERLRNVHEAGARMVAVIDSIQGAENPYNAAENMVREWDRLESEH